MRATPSTMLPPSGTDPPTARCPSRAASAAACAGQRAGGLPQLPRPRPGSRPAAAGCRKRPVEAVSNQIDGISQERARSDDRFKLGMESRSSRVTFAGANEFRSRSSASAKPKREGLRVAQPSGRSDGDCRDRVSFCIRAAAADVRQCDSGAPSMSMPPMVRSWPTCWSPPICGASSRTASPASSRTTSAVCAAADRRRAPRSRPFARRPPRS